MTTQRVPSEQGNGQFDQQTSLVDLLAEHHVIRKVTISQLYFSKLQIEIIHPRHQNNAVRSAPVINISRS